jgi:preprotein translocase subunit SecA
MIERVQRKMEAHNFDIRKNLLEYDAVNNEQRKEIYGWRQSILDGRDQSDRVTWAIEGVAKQLADQYLASLSPDEKPDVDALRTSFQQRFAVEAPPGPELATKTAETAAALLAAHAKKAYAAKRELFGKERIAEIERYIVLQTIDAKWKDHLQALDYLRTGIGMRGYGQEDPKVVYRREAHGFFQQMIESIQQSIAEFLFRMEPPKEEPEPSVEEQPEAAAPSGPPPFDEDDWGPDDDGVDWMQVAAATAEARIRAAQAAEEAAGRAAAKTASSGMTTATLVGLDEEPSTGDRPA